MSSLSQVSEAMKKILTERASALERPTGFVQRSSAYLRGEIFTESGSSSDGSPTRKPVIRNCDT